MDRLETEDERWFRINVENKYYEEQMKKYCKPLTDEDIMQAFPDEAKELVKVVYKKLLKEIDHFNKDIEVLISYGIYANIKADHLIRRKRELESLAMKYNLPGINFAKLEKQKDIDLEPVKAVPILSIHDFSKIRKTGNKYMVSCPFHKDNTPSMLIDDRNMFKCFSCGKGGTNIDFVMELNGFTFIQAVNWILQRK